jgi:hypothetical protein
MKVTCPALNWVTLFLSRPLVTGCCICCCCIRPCRACPVATYHFDKWGQILGVDKAISLLHYETHISRHLLTQTGDYYVLLTSLDFNIKYFLKHGQLNIIHTQHDFYTYQKGSQNAWRALGSQCLKPEAFLLTHQTFPSPHTFPSSLPTLFICLSPQYTHL